MKRFIALFVFFALCLVGFAQEAQPVAEPVKGFLDGGLSFFASNWAELLLGLLAFVKVIVRLTPTIKDDAIFGKIDNLISAIFPNIEKKK